LSLGVLRHRTLARRQTVIDTPRESIFFDSIDVDARLYFLYTGVSDAVAFGRTSLPSSLSNFEQVKGRLETGCSAFRPLQKIP